MTDNRKLKVIIVGVGIAGLVLANCLIDTNIDFIMLEMYDYKKEYHGSDFYLSPNGIRVLDQLGIWERIKDKGVFTNFVDFIGKDNNKWATLDWTGIEEKYGYPIFSIIRQKLLIELWRNINDNNIDIGKKVINIKEYDEKKLEVICEDGTTYKCDFVVGADGSFSKVRKIIYEEIGNELPDSDRDYLNLNSEYSAIFGVSKKSEDISCNGRLEWHIQPNLSYFLHVQPEPNNEITWFLGEKKDETVKDKYNKLDLEEIKNKYKDLKTNHGCTLGDILDRSIVSIKVNLEEKLFETWYHNRIVLIGDAAHKLLPYGSQGANQAIEDAVVLTNCLYNYFKNYTKNYKNMTTNDYKNIFEEYQSLRKPRVKKLFDESKNTKDLINIPNLYYKILSKIIYNMPTYFFSKTLNERFKYRPILLFKEEPKTKKPFEDYEYWDGNVEKYKYPIF
jgi:FAD dependent monooxygenase